MGGTSNGLLARSASKGRIYPCWRCGLAGFGLFPADEAVMNDARLEQMAAGRHDFVARTDAVADFGELDSTNARHNATLLEDRVIDANEDEINLALALNGLRRYGDAAGRRADEDFAGAESIRPQQTIGILDLSADMHGARPLLDAGTNPGNLGDRRLLRQAVRLEAHFLTDLHFLGVFLPHVQPNPQPPDVGHDHLHLRGGDDFFEYHVALDDLAIEWSSQRQEFGRQLVRIDFTADGLRYAEQTQMLDALVFRQFAQRIEIDGQTEVDEGLLIIEEAKMR